MAEFKIDIRDIEFCLFEQLDIDALLATEAYRGQSREDYAAILREAEKLAREVIFPTNAPGDHEGARFVEGRVKVPASFHKAYKAYAEGGWIAASQPEDAGGLGLPGLVAVAISEAFTAANTAFMMTPGLTLAASRVISTVGSPEQQAIYVRPMNEGRWGGTMCLTEPQAGSYVGDARTTATPAGDGTYRIAGNKIFISSGDQDLTENIVHLVLARTPDAAPGTKGLSLFVVPTYRVNPDGSLGAFNDVRCTGIEEKMGIHGSPTCSMSFGDDGDCHGTIIGKPGEGMRHMFLMMNEARLAVGVQGMAAGNLAYQLALSYARERRQGVSVKNFRNADAERVPIIEHPNVRFMLLRARALSEGCRALMLRAAYCADMAEHAADEATRKKNAAMLEILTPICKAYGSEAGLEAADLAVQIHGGYGYIREYGVEQLMRDVKIASIYEGTNSIQAIDLLARKVARNAGADFRGVVGEIQSFLKAHGEHYTLTAEMQALQKGLDALVEVTMAFAGRQMTGDLSYPIMHAKPYLRMFGHVLLSWLLLDQAIRAEAKVAAAHQGDHDLERDEHPELRYATDKGRTARYFVHQVLPAVHGIASSIKSNDVSALDAHF